jgi:hypothetical protein
MAEHMSARAFTTLETKCPGCILHVCVCATNHAGVLTVTAVHLAGCKSTLLLAAMQASDTV